MTTQDFTEKIGVLIELMRKGDTKSWRKIYKLCNRELKRDTERSVRGLIFKRNLKVPEEVIEAIRDDATQDTWVTAFHQIETFRFSNETEAYHWLLTVALNHARRILNGYSRRRYPPDDNEQFSDEDRLDRLLYVYQGSEPTPEEELLLKARLAATLKVIDTLRLNSIHQEILMRRIRQEESISDLARTYNLQPQTVSQILFRIRQMIIANLPEEFRPVPKKRGKTPRRRG